MCILMSKPHVVAATFPCMPWEMYVNNDANSFQVHVPSSALMEGPVMGQHVPVNKVFLETTVIKVMYNLKLCLSHWRMFTGCG